MGGLQFENTAQQGGLIRWFIRSGPLPVLGIKQKLNSRVADNLLIQGLGTWSHLFEKMLSLGLN